MSIYEDGSTLGFAKSMPYFEGKDNPVKHILVLTHLR